MNMNIKTLQDGINWALHPADAFEQDAFHRNLNHDVLHLSRSVGKLSAMLEQHDHPKEVRKQPRVPDSQADVSTELADIVIMCLHISKLIQMDLETSVLRNLASFTTLPKETSNVG